MTNSEVAVLRLDPWMGLGSAVFRYEAFYFMSSRSHALWLPSQYPATTLYTWTVSQPLRLVKT